MAAVGVVVLVASHALAQDSPVDRLPEKDRVWLEEEVVYIITARERDAFVSLESAEERKFFIDAFWRRRDPNPVTPENEFQEEHYRRVAYANSKLDAGSLLPGWKTAQGRMYIILGDPRSVEQYSMDNKLVTTELWFYEGDTTKGLPPFLNLIFFKRMDTGEFRLYSPSADGPSALLRGRFSVDPQVAIQTIVAVSPDLARAALSIEARAGGDLESGIASLDNEVTMMRIEESPSYAIRAHYLDGWERFGDRVAAEYSFNFVPSRGGFAVLPAADGAPFVHFTIELDPENFSVETVEGADVSKFYTTLDVSVEARNDAGQLVVAEDKETYIELSQSEMESIRLAPIAYQDSVPIIPGEYTFHVILKNRVHTRFTAAEHEISVPSFAAEAPALSDVVIGYRVEDARLAGAEGAGSGVRTFQLDDIRIHPSADRVFTQDEWLHTLVRVINPGANLVRYELMSGDDVVARRDVRAGGVIQEAFALTGMESGDYDMLVELVDPNGAVTAETVTAFRISPRTAIPRPNFIARRQFPSSEPGRVALARAEQFSIVGEHDAAVRELERAVAAENPNLPAARWQLASAYNRMSRPDDALALLTPMADAFSKQFDVAMGLGVAYYIKEDFENAVYHFERAMAIRPPNTSQLNALGNSYVRLGRVDDAETVYRRSLALDPSQASVEKALSALVKDS